MTLDYIVLSPVGDHRTKHIEEFIEAAKSFTPPPKEIVLCVDIDTELDWDYEGVTIKYNPDIIEARSCLERICSSREILRNHFIYGSHELALWIDSDIIAPPETPLVLHKVMEDEKVLIVVNKYQGRNSPNEYWCGSGIMLTMKNACTVSKFWIGRMYDEDGNKHNLSEDFIFFSIFDQASNRLRVVTGRGGRICKEFVKVQHHIEWRN